MACNCERKERLLKKLSETDIRKNIYMDYNATTPVLNQCLGAFELSCRKNWGNPSSIHPAGAKAWEALENDRKKIADFFLSSPEDILFCSSGSEAIFAAVYSLADRDDDSFFITTSIEHSAVIRNITPLPAHRYHILKVSADGRIDISELSSVLSKNRGRKIRIVYSPVNHETGGIQPVKEIYEKAKNFGAVIIFDAVQTAARLAASEWRKYCDIFAASSHKLYAPKGCGVLCMPEKLRSMEKFRVFRHGGSQEHSLFPGTENTPSIAAFAKACEYLKDNFDTISRDSRVLTSEGVEILKKLPLEINIESPATRADGILCVSIPAINDIEEFLDYIYLMGISISRFSACSEDIKKPSEILLQMGREKRRAEKSIRISTGIFSKRDDYFCLSDAIKDYAAEKNLL